MSTLIGALFVDGANISFSLKRRGSVVHPLRIHYPALESALRVRCSPDGLSLVDWRFKHYYTAHRDVADQEKRAGLDSALREGGWMIMDLQAKEYREGYFKDKQVDITLALDAYQLALMDQVNVVAFVTHDADFAACVNKIKADRPKISTYVVGWTDEMASELVKSTKVVPLQEIWKSIERR